MENVNKRRLVIRVALVVLLVLLCFGLYYIGKEHDVYVDNKTVTIDGREYREIEYLALVVNGDEKDSVEYFAGDRDVLKLQGPNHTLRIIVMDEDTEEVIKTVERKLSLGTIARDHGLDARDSGGGGEHRASAPASPAGRARAGAGRRTSGRRHGRRAVLLGITAAERKYQGPRAAYARGLTFTGGTRNGRNDGLHHPPRRMRRQQG